MHISSTARCAQCAEILKRFILLVRALFVDTKKGLLESREVFFELIAKLTEFHLHIKHSDARKAELLFDIIHTVLEAIEPLSEIVKPRLYAFAKFGILATESIEFLLYAFAKFGILATDVIEPFKERFECRFCVRIIVAHNALLNSASVANVNEPIDSRWRAEYYPRSPQAGFPF